VFVIYFIVQWSSMAEFVCDGIQLAALVMFRFFYFSVIFVVSTDHFSDFYFPRSVKSQMKFYCSNTRPLLSAIF
jgi:hypothetical protein